jgi:hypothetical protein
MFINGKAVQSIRQHDSMQQNFSICIQNRTGKAWTADGTLLSIYDAPSIQDT